MMTSLVSEVPGDFAEIGVYRGDTFHKLAIIAQRQGRIAHAFDSFHGMAEPSTMDDTDYPKGKFNIGGPSEFVRLMDKKRIPIASYNIHAGYIPNCFVYVPDSMCFALVIIDVDHYQPTKDSLEWVAPRIVYGGILALDDYIPEYNKLASRAISEWYDSDTHFETISYENQQLILRKRI